MENIAWLAILDDEEMESLQNLISDIEKAEKERR